MGKALWVIKHHLQKKAIEAVQRKGNEVWQRTESRGDEMYQARKALIESSTCSTYKVYLV